MGRDDKVAAIVLRINSGGGSANASEQIWQAVAEARESKPVVVSMGPVAASGGYYIAAGATKIFALPTTLTGSIGVVGGKLAMRGVADKLGVSVHEVHRGERALMWSAMDPWTTGERAAVQAMMERVYERFVARVAEGRKQTADQIKGVAEGRVWTGADAKGHGLVDELGGLADALAAARELGGVDPATALEVYPPEPTLRDIVASFEDGPPGLVSLGPALDLAAELDPQLAAAVTRQLRALLLLRESRVLAIGELPLVR